jgi:hypothetical protein
MMRACFLLLLLPWALWGQSAPEAPASGSPIAGGRLYRLSGRLAVEGQASFASFAVQDSVPLTAAQGSALQLQAAPEAHRETLQALCLFSPNMGLLLIRQNGTTEQYLLAFDCGQLALASDRGLFFYLGNAEQLQRLQRQGEQLLRAAKPPAHEWIPALLPKP